MKYTTYFSICLALRRKKVYTLITVHSGKVVWKKDQIDNMEEEMKEMAKRTAVAALAGVMSVGMLSGCGSKTLDGTKTVATVDGTDIPLGVVSLYAREQQQRTTAMYMSYMGSADNIWDQTADEDSGETYGDQAVTSSLESIEKMYILKEKASDYNVELTDEDETAIAVMMKNTAEYSRGNASAPYSMEDALADAYAAILLKKAVETGEVVHS